MGDNDQVAGFVYIGTPAAPSTERVRPDLTEKVSYWGVNHV